MLENIILGFLLFKDASGYDLKQWMTQSTSYFYDASFGSIYPALKRLEEKGLITFREVVEGSKYKKLYSINENGKEAFMNWLEEPIVFTKSNHEHLLKIFFYDKLPKEKALKELKDFVKQVELVVKELSDQKDEVEKKYDTSKFAFKFSTIIYGTEVYQFVVNWCNDLIKKVEEE